MKKLFIFLLPLCVSTAFAQDVIVKHDGSTILSKVIKIGTTEVEYKKFSNQNGPTYSILKSDIQAINYENGEKETFDDAKPVQAATNIQTQTLSFGVNPNLAEDNLNQIITEEDGFINDKIITDYNDRYVTPKLLKSTKNAKWVYRTVKIHTSSSIGNRDGRIHLAAGQGKGTHTAAFFDVIIENTSDEIMYVDLGSTSLRIHKNASVYFVNSATTTTTSSGTGMSVNLGSIASLLGVGGALGTLSSGTSIGGGSSSGTSTTVFAERVKTIPPHSTFRLKRKLFYESVVEKPYKTDFYIGDNFSYSQPIAIKDTPWEIIVSYAMERDLNCMKRFDVGLYVSGEIAVDKSWESCIENEGKDAPLHYFYKVDKY